MQTAEEQMETVHLYVVPENQLPPKPDYLGMVITALCLLVLATIGGLLLFSPKADPVVSFKATIVGFKLPPAIKTLQVTVRASGKGHVDATYAAGEITFYNGQTYTQIIPVGTILKGRDGIAVITDEQAVIPPAAETFPPTYGHVDVRAHALLAGAGGNIPAGDINEACCVTSVIAQNPYTFTGGVDAQDFTYLTRQDVMGALASLFPQLQKQTLASFPSSIVLEPACSTTYTSTPAIGLRTQSARLTVREICYAASYSLINAKKQILQEGEQQYGSITLTDIQFDVVRIAQRNEGVRLDVYVTAVVKPVLHLRFGNTGK
jgi:hypothetical protein